MSAASFFSFIALYRYEVLFSFSTAPMITKIKIPDLGSEMETIIGPNNRKISYPRFTQEEELNLTVIVDEKNKSTILNNFYAWEAAKYSDSSRKFLNLPENFLKNVIVNLLDRQLKAPFRTFVFKCVPASIGLLPDLDYANKTDKVAINVILKVWERTDS
jgi:hypothetical protein